MIKGEKQALSTGERLKELNFPYTNIIRSTMTRATQTASLIQKYLPEVPVKDCSMIEEGAPIFPEPPNAWKPELYVSFTILVSRKKTRHFLTYVFDEMYTFFATIKAFDSRCSEMVLV